MRACLQAGNPRRRLRQKKADSSLCDSGARNLKQLCGKCGLVLGPPGEGPTPRKIWVAHQMGLRRVVLWLLVGMCRPPFVLLYRGVDAPVPLDLSEIRPRMRRHMARSAEEVERQLRHRAMRVPGWPWRTLSSFGLAVSTRVHPACMHTRVLEARCPSRSHGGPSPSPPHTNPKGGCAARDSTTIASRRETTGDAVVQTCRVADQPALCQANSHHRGITLPGQAGCSPTGAFAKEGC